MKKTFRMALVLALAGSALMYTGCTKDYSEDLSKLDDRLSTLESSTAIADLTKQVNDLKTAVSALEAAKQAADQKIADLQGKTAATDAVVESLRGQIADNVATIAAIQKAMENYATKAEVEAANAKIAALQDANTTLTNQVKSLLADAATLSQAVGKLQGLVEGLQTQIDDAKAEIAKKADQTYVDATFATKQTVENIAVRVGVLEGTIADINAKLTKALSDLDILNGNELVEGSVKQQIKAAKDELTAAYIAADDALRVELTKAIDAVRDALTAETAERKEADSLLWKNFDNYYTAAQIDAKEAALKSEIAQEAKARIAADSLLNVQIKAVEAGYKAADAQIIKDYKAADAAIIAAYKAADAKLDAKIDSVLTVLKAADEQLQKNIDALEETIMEKFKSYYTKAEVDALCAGLQKQITDNKTAIEGLEKSKLDVAAFEAWKKDVYAVEMAAVNKAISDEIARATKKEGELVKVDEDLQKQINDITKDIATKYAEYQKKVKELEAAIAARDAKIEAIAERVQAISFVPEFTKGSSPVAASTLVLLDGKALKTQQTVEASFQVKPAAKAQAVADALAKGNAYVVYVPVTTKSAAAPAKATLTSLVAVNTAAGKVDVRAQIPSTSANIAIALVYEEAEVEGKPYANNKVVSDYAAVAQETLELKDAVDLYYKGTHGGYIKYGNQDVQKPWDEAPAQVDWYGKDGSQYMIKYPDGAVVDFAGFRAKYNFTVTELPDPVMKVKYVWTLKKTGKALLASKTIGASSEAEIAFAQDYVKMASDVLAKAAVGEKTTGTNNVYLKGVKVFTKTNSYEIIKRQIDAVIEPYTITWNYDNIVKLSTAKTAAGYLQKPVDKVYDENLRELHVTIADKYNDIDLKAICASAPIKCTVNGTTTAQIMDVDATAYIAAQLAEVSLAGGKYNYFGTTAATKTFVNKYDIAGEETEVNVKWDVTFTAKAADQKVTIANKTFATVPATGTPATIALTAAETYEKAYAGVKAQFGSTQATWTSDFKANSAVTAKTYKRTAQTAKTITTGETKLDMTVPQVVLDRVDLATFADKFSYDVTYTAWYGTKYQWVLASADMTQPSFYLALWPDMTAAETTDGNAKSKYADGVATIKGTEKGGKYVINEDYLNKYFKVEGVLDLTAAQRAALKIVYKDVTNTADYYKAALYTNAPAITANNHTVAEDGSIVNSVPNADAVVWGDYSARDILVAAVLTYDGIEVPVPAGVAKAKNQTVVELYTADPIVKVATDQLSIEREEYKNYVNGMWQGITINGILDPAKNLVKKDDKELAKAIKDLDKYGATVTFADAAKIYMQYVDEQGNTIKQQIYDYPATKAYWTAVGTGAPKDDATFTFVGDSAYLHKDIVAEVDVTVDHKYDVYHGVKCAHKATASICYSQK